MTNPQPQTSLVSLKLSDEDKMALMKKISSEVNKKSFKLPKKNCKHCYGRGFIGYMQGVKSLPVPCRCTFIKPQLGKKK